MKRRITSPAEVRRGVSPSTIYRGAAIALSLSCALSVCDRASFALPVSTQAAVATDGGMTEAKALYASGRYIEALGKFTTILRSDPHNDEARQYLRLIVDNMKKPAAVSKKKGKAAPPVPVAALSDDARKRLVRRALLAMDLATIPDVRVIQRENGSEADLPSDFLFNANQPGLKEQAIPLLDRVAAWLRTFDQPIIIHCYPEELEDPGKNGRLFLKRYAELYSFFTDEKKLNSSRFLSSEDLEGDKPSGDEESIQPPKGAHVVVIEVVGVDYVYQDGLLSSADRSTPWLEHSILAKPLAFNPREGEFSTIDLAALARVGVRKWEFSISPETQPDKPVLSMAGAGNLLKRLSWDGRDPKTGEFERPGNYIAHLESTNNEGHTLTKEVQILIASTAGAAPLAPVKHAAKKVKKIQKKAAAVKPAARATAGEAPVVPVEAPLAEPPSAHEHASSTQTEAAADTGSSGADDAEGSANAIWKQVIQFDENDSNIKASLRASLERIGKTLEVYPLQKVRIVGFANVGETDAALLAKKRAETIRTVLIEEYRVAPARVIVAGGRTSSSRDASKVELSITN